MARPKKTSLDYFSVDVDIVQDLKVRKLMSRKGGARALGVLMSLLCQIYKNGYYLEYNEDMVFVIASDLYEEEDYVKEIIRYCLDVGLFDQTMYDEHRVLTSHGIQERYVAVQAHYKRISVVDKYKLLDDENPPEKVSSTNTWVSSEETLVNTEETNESENKCGRNTMIEEVSSDLSTQKKKENKNKINIIPSSTTAPAREESALEEEFPPDKRLDEEVRLLLKDSVWADCITSKYNLPTDKLGDYLEAFKTDCLARGKLQHTSREDLKSHFSDWLRIQIEKQDKAHVNGKSRYISQGNTATSTDPRRSAPVAVGARQEDFSGTF